MNDEYANDLFWHALNYRGAADRPDMQDSNPAELCWQQLLACHGRLVAAAVAAERERCAKIADVFRIHGADPDGPEGWQNSAAACIADEIREGAASAQHLDTSPAICDNPRT